MVLIPDLSAKLRNMAVFDQGNGTTAKTGSSHSDSKAGIMRTGCIRNGIQFFAGNFVVMT
jgi:hypothetical protein